MTANLKIISKEGRFEQRAGTIISRPNLYHVEE
jgi:hypothetical protein